MDDYYHYLPNLRNSAESEGKSNISPNANGNELFDRDYIFTFGKDEVIRAPLATLLSS